MKVQPWICKTRPTEATIWHRLNEEGLHPYRWSNGPGDVYQAHHHGYNKVIYVIQGSITFGLPDEARHVTLQIGDRLDLPAGVIHNAQVGPDGVACLEAHRP